MKTPDVSQVQVGCNVARRTVSIRTPDEKSPGGQVIQVMSPEAARALADWLGDGVINKTLRITDGKRWSEQLVPKKSAAKLAADLRGCADEVDPPPPAA
jgi:hypothetical protein